MAACGSLQHIFDKPMPPNSPTLIESLSSPAWTPITPMKSMEDSSFTEIFGELHFKENHHHHHHDHHHHDHQLHDPFSSSCSSPFSTPSSSIPYSTSPFSTSTSSSSSSSSTSSLSLSLPLELSTQEVLGLLHKDKNDSSTINEKNIKSPTSIYPAIPTRRRSDSFSSMNSESLSMCTEGLGFESSDDVEDLMNDTNIDHQQSREGRLSTINAKHAIWNPPGQLRRTRSVETAFPPPISSIGTSGKPWACFKSYRHGGRFILKEVRVPTQEFLQAYREDGRLKLHIFQSNDKIPEGDEGDDDGDDEIDGEEEANGKECEDDTGKDDQGQGNNDAEKADICNKIGSFS